MQIWFWLPKYSTMSLQLQAFLSSAWPHFGNAFSKAQNKVSNSRIMGSTARNKQYHAILALWLCACILRIVRWRSCPIWLLTLLAKIRHRRMVMVSWLWQKNMMYSKSGFAGCCKKNLKKNFWGQALPWARLGTSHYSMEKENRTCIRWLISRESADHFGMFLVIGRVW